MPRGTYVCLLVTTGLNIQLSGCILHSCRPVLLILIAIQICVFSVYFTCSKLYSGQINNIFLSFLLRGTAWHCVRLHVERLLLDLNNLFYCTLEKHVNEDLHFHYYANEAPVTTRTKT